MRFWSRIFAVSFAMGVVSGIVLQVITATRDYTGGSLGYTPERTLEFVRREREEKWLPIVKATGANRRRRSSSDGGSAMPAAVSTASVPIHRPPPKRCVRCQNTARSSWMPVSVGRRPDSRDACAGKVSGLCA